MLKSLFRRRPDHPKRPSQPAGLSQQALTLSPSSHGGHWITHNNDSTIGHLIRMNGHFQESDMDPVLDFLGKTKPQFDKKVFLDIGANIGTHSVYAAKKGFERVVSAEPDPINFRLCQINAILHDVPDICDIHNCGISEASGTMSLARSPTNFGDHRILSEGGAALEDQYNEADRKSFEVEVMTLDALCAKAGVAPRDISLIWVDTQGHEGAIFAGADKVMAAGPDIVTEFWPYGLARAGGYANFRARLGQFAKIYDLGQHDANGDPLAISIEDIDKMNAEYVKIEREDNCAYTDLLLMS